MFKKKLLKWTMATMAVVTPVVALISCNSGKNNLRKNKLSYDDLVQPEWMIDLDMEKKTFTLDLSNAAFAELKVLESEEAIAKIPFFLSKKETVDGKEVKNITILKVTKIIFGSNLEEIQPYVFAGFDEFSAIKELVFPADSKLTKIGDYAFAGNVIESLTLPNGVSSIGKGAFEKNTISELKFSPTNVTISDGAFWANHLTGQNLTASSTIVLGKDVFGNQSPKPEPKPDDTTENKTNPEPTSE